MNEENDNNDKPRSLKKGKNYFLPLAVLLLIVAVVILGRFTREESGQKEITYGDLWQMLEGKHESFDLKEAVMRENAENSSVKIIYVDRATDKETTVSVSVGDRHEALDAKLVSVLGAKYNKKEPSPFIPFLITVAPWIILIVLFWFIFLRQMRAPGGGNVLSFGRSRAKIGSQARKRVTFADVAGIEEAKEEVQEIIEFLKNPGRFQKIGGRIPRGVLLVGPPGCGKTLLARAIAGEADRPFFSISGSDFVEMFVGVGASRVRDLFKQAKENSPCIVFLDEIDAVGRRRGTGLGGGHDEREQTLNAILVEMDGFDTDEGIITLAATNRPDVLDPALLRPGRFDREIVIDLPDVKGRAEILAVHARKVRMESGVDLDVLARGTPYFSGADLEALINEAALRAVIKDQEAVRMEDLEEARDKVLWGRQKKSRVMDEEDRKITAYHEAGHALLSILLPDSEPLHKVTIIPRGMALGATMSLPERDKYHKRRSRLLSEIKSLYGGRAAEKIFFEDVTAGAASDIKRASELARLMVTQWGMSDALGPVSYSDAEEHLFLGREILKQTNRSEDTARQIDVEVRTILDKCFSESEELIRKNRKSCERIAAGLMKHEVLSGAEVAALAEGADVENIKSLPPQAASAQKQKAPSGRRSKSKSGMTDAEKRALEEHGGAEPAPL